MALAGEREYDLKRIVVTFNGVPISGAADGDFIVVTPSAETFTKAAGGRGEMAVSRNTDESGTIEITLWQHSRVNRAIIENAIRLQKSREVGLSAPISISIKDLNNGENLVAARCWIEQEPTRNFGPEAQGYTYTFAYDELQVLPL